MNTLDQIALKHGTDKSSQYHGYCYIYERYFTKFKDASIRLLELGVQFGFSIKTWLDYFTNAQVYGIDVIADFKSDDPRCHLFVGDQNNQDMLKQIANEAQGFHIIIDDGCHLADAQATSFQALWPFVKPGGYYIIEDVFTWSDPYFLRPLCGLKWLSQQVANLNQNGKQYHGKPHPINMELTYLETSIEFIHLYRGLVIFGKKYES